MNAQSNKCIGQSNISAYIDSPPLDSSFSIVTPGKNVNMSTRAIHNRMIHTPPANLVNRGYTFPGQGIPYPLCSTLAEDRSVMCGNSVLFPTLKTHNLCHRVPFESPAKVFAMLKAKVKKEQMCGRDGVCEKEAEREIFRRDRDIQIGGSPSPRKRQHPWTIAEMKENQGVSFHPYEAEALILSPIHSPRKPFSHPYSNFSSKDLPLPSPQKGMGDVFKPVKGCSARRQTLYPSPVKVHPLASSNAHQRPVRTSCTTIPMKMQPPSLKSSNGSHEIDANVPDIMESGHHPRLSKAFVAVERLSVCSPAKMFAQMKEREKQREQQEAFRVSSSTQELRRGDSGVLHCQSTSTPVPQDMAGDTSMDVTSSIAGTAFTAATSQLETTAPTNLESADSQYESETEMAPPPTVKPRSALVDNSFLHASPRISIPKKRQANFLSKSTAEAAGSRHRKDGSAAGIHLRDWILRCNGTGLFVDGVRRDNDMLWHSNVIAERVSSTVVKTVSGSTYVLVGKITLDISTTLPRWLLKKFLFGFPQNWKIYYEQFLTESKGQVCSENKLVVTESQSASLTPHIVKTPKTVPAVPVCPSSAPCLPGEAKVSRSGRVIKPPLEFWKGGRIVLDSNMNVTVHQGYESSVCELSMNTPVARGKTAKTMRPAKVFIPTDNSSNDENEESVPVRKVRVLHRRPQKSKPDPEKEPPNTNSSKGCNLRPRTFIPPHQWVEPVTYPDSASHSIALPVRRSQRNASKLSSQSDSSPSIETRRPHSILMEPPKVYSVHSKCTNQKKKEKSSSVQVTRKAARREQSDVEGEEVRPRHSRREARPRLSRREAVGKDLQAPDREARLEEEPMSQSEDDLHYRRQRRSRKIHSRKNHSKIRNSDSETNHRSLSNQVLTSTDEEGMSLRKKRGGSQKLSAVTSNKAASRSKALQKPEPLPQPQAKNKIQAPAEEVQGNKQSFRGKKSRAGGPVDLQEGEEQENMWTESELSRLHEAVASFPKHMGSFWLNVAMVVGTRSAEECQEQYTAQKSCPVNSAKPRKKKEAPPKKDPVVEAQITAKAGTLKRKQQIRNFLEYMPKDNHDDIFISSPMKNKRVKLPTASPGGRDNVFMSPGGDPQSPCSAGFPTVKTPQYLHITPGMMGSVNNNDDDKYIYQLQKRMKKGQAKVHKCNPTSKFTPTPPVKRAMKRCVSPEENGSFVIREMFPDEKRVSDESGEEDYYFDDD